MLDAGWPFKKSVLFNSTIMMISIYIGTQIFETRECTLVRLPDGRDGAIWRGLAYPLELPDYRINMGVEAFPPGRVRADGRQQHQRTSNQVRGDPRD